MINLVRQRLLRFHRSELVAAIIFIAVLCAWVVPGFMHSLGQADQFAGLERAPWSAANSWIKAAECTYRTGKLLVGCVDDDVVVPYATRFHADDPGHALLLGIIALIGEAPPALPDISRVNTVVNYVGLLALAGGLFLTGAGIAASLFLLLAVPLVNASHALSPHPAQFGVACLAALPALVLFARRQGQVANPYVFGSALLVAFFALVGALLLREAIGMMGVLAAMIAGLFWVWSARRRGESIVTPLAVAGISVALLWAPASLLKVRDLAYGLEPSTNMEQHGISHPLFVGLGVVPNSFGIEWRDVYGFERAREINPEVHVFSKEYYGIVKELYFKTIISDPIETIRIYISKTFLALKVKFYMMRLWYILFIAALLNISFFFIREKSDRERHHIPAAVVGGIFSACFLAQGALINPRPTYMAPAFLFALLAFVAAIQELIVIVCGAQVRASSFNSVHSKPT